MKKVATRNWGDKYRGVSNLMGLKATGTAASDAALRAEAAAHDGTHGYGRHGAQTGWEAQFIRAVTKVTPDQSYDPMGLNPTHRHWNGVMSYSSDDGAPVFDLFEDHVAEPTHHATAAGNVSGGFITPEAQFLARARGNQVLGRLNGPLHYAAQYRFKTEHKFINVPITSVHIVVSSGRPGGLYGLGFAQRKGTSYTSDRAFVVRMIDAFLNRKTGAQLFPGAPNLPSLKMTQWIITHKSKPLFADMEELAEFFDIDILWQPNCSLIFRRTHVPATHSHTNWRLITMFPDDLEPGWGPSLFLSPALKQALMALHQGFNKNDKDYHWTGLTRSHDGALRMPHPVPPWRP